MRENWPVILAVGPTVALARQALDDNGLECDGGQRFRMVTRYGGLGGWTHGMPVVAVEMNRWEMLAGADGAKLRETLLTMLHSGRLRIAQDADLARFRAEAVQ